MKKIKVHRTRMWMNVILLPSKTDFVIGFTLSNISLRSLRGI